MATPITVRGDTELTVDGQTIKQAGTAPQTLTVNGDNNTMTASTGGGIDTLIANGWGNTLKGGAGADVLTAYGDDNTLIAGSGNGQQLYVAGNDALLIGGSGRNQSFMVDGNDAVVIGKGSGSVMLVNGNHALMVGGAYGDQSLTVFGNDSLLLGGTGANTLTAYGNNNILAVAGCDVTKISNSNGCGPAVYDADIYRHRADVYIERLVSSVDLPEIPSTAQSSYSECGSYGWSNGCGSWNYSSGWGCAPKSAYYGCGGASGPDQVLYLEGNDGVLIGGGKGDNSLYAMGNNNLLVAGDYGTQALTIDGNDGVVVGGGSTGLITINGNNALAQAGDTGTQSITVNGNDGVLIGGGSLGYLTANGNENTLFAGACGTQFLTVNGWDCTLIGGSGINFLSANGNYNTLEAGRGVNTLIGGGMENIYEVDLRDGRTKIVNGSVDNGGAANTLQFTAGIDANDLWFQQRGNDLRIDINGTSNYVDVIDWFLDSNNQLQAIQTLDGGVLDTGEIQQLVSAMSAFSNPYGGSDPYNAQLPSDQGLQTLLASAWQA